MNSRERFLAACSSQALDRPPLWVMRQAGRYLPEYRALKARSSFLEMVRTPELATEVTLQPLRCFELDAAILFSDILVIPEALGQGYQFRDGGGIAMEGHVDTRARVEALAPASAVPERLEYMAGALRLIREELAGKKALLGFGGSPWTLATYMVEGGSSEDFGRVKQLFYTDRGTFDALLERLTEAVIACFRLQIAAGADAVKLGGDKRRVAVLFSDIRGFTALSETMNPDAMARLLTEYFSEMVECVFRHGGTLDKFIGDAVMAQWGAPLGESDDADRAMASALDMMEALDTLNEHWTQQGRPTLQIGIGLNIGDAFAGNIGSERRLEYTVIGDTVNTASRLCGVAGAGEILVSESFRSALMTPPRLDAIAPIELKGKSQPVPVFKVVR